MKESKKILFVLIITILTMVAEIYFGFISNSMALLADGFHMGTHALAFGLTYIAYYFCNKYINSNKFTSGTEKINELAGYTSSLFLGLSGILIIYESIGRIFNPLKIDFSQALIVIIIGLVINLICIIVMDFDHFHNHIHNHNHIHKKTDNNFKSAYLHILADLLTSVGALFALILAKYFGWVLLDPIIGIFGGLIILKWAIGLIKATTIKLLDIDTTKK